MKDVKGSATISHFE